MTVCPSCFVYLPQKQGTTIAKCILVTTQCILVAAQCILVATQCILFAAQCIPTYSQLILDRFLVYSDKNCCSLAALAPLQLVWDKAHNAKKKNI